MRVQTIMRTSYIKYVAATVAAVMVMLVGLVAQPSQTAYADISGCHNFQATSVGRGDYSRWTSRYTVPSSSGCRDIQISHVTLRGTTIHCGQFRVRFYPSSGGFIDGATHAVCTSGNSNWVLATNVLNGTRYDVEYFFPSNCVGCYYDFRITD